MKVSYYPGCTLRNKAQKLDTYAHNSAAALGIELCEPDDWQCCGGTFTISNDEIATKLSSIRVLADARDKNRPLVTICSACHNVIKQTNHAMQTDKVFAERVNNYLAQDETPITYHGEAQVIHYLEMLRDIIGFDKLKEKVVNPLKGRKIAAYYGCLLLRPSEAMRFDDPENPTIMESFIKAIGAEPVIFPARNECCGAYLSLENPDNAKKRCGIVSSSAKNHGADTIVTACPLCRYNLIKQGSELPVIYFTELLAEALGVKEEQK